jgi:hypothetical protein
MEFDTTESSEIEILNQRQARVGVLQLDVVEVNIS